MSNNDSIKTVVFDIDGVIAGKSHGGEYAQAEPLLYGIEQVNAVYNLGYKVVLFTARYGDREKGCIQRMYQRGYAELIDWLNKHGVKYHEVWMGKPAGILYADDKGVRISGDNNNGWEQFWVELEETKNRDKFGNNL